jgi:hypothetical protein
MSDGLLMVVAGICIIVFGARMTAVIGPMPEATPIGPPPRRLRIVLIVFGTIMLVWGIAKLVMYG